MADETRSEEVERTSLYLAEARWRRDDQAERHESLNRRLNTLFALNFAVLAVLGASLQLGEQPLPDFLDYFVFSTLFVLVCNILLLMFAYRVGKGSRRPDLEALKNLLDESHSLVITIQWTVREIRKSMVVNEDQLKAKGKLISVAMISSGIAVIMVATGAALSLSFAVVVCG